MRILRSVGGVLALPLLLVGCGVLGGTGATLSGTVSASYFGITSDVMIVLVGADATFAMEVPLAGWSSQEGAFVFANIPPATYAVQVGFDTDNGYMPGTTYSVNGGSWTGVDDEQVTGVEPPYTFSISIDSLQVADDTTLDVYFGSTE